MTQPKVGCLTVSKLKAACQAQKQQTWSCLAPSSGLSGWPVPTFWLCGSLRLRSSQPKLAARKPMWLTMLLQPVQGFCSPGFKLRGCVQKSSKSCRLLWWQYLNCILGQIIYISPCVSVRNDWTLRCRFKLHCTVPHFFTLYWTAQVLSKYVSKQWEQCCPPVE